ncbi:MAG: adenine deaminase C-terminal domain-containing protein [Candidatus Kariarchaeaceae archaeon]
MELYVSETKNLPLEFLVEIPSCVPAASSLENGSAILTSDDYVSLVKDDRFFALAEMMNFPGVIYRDPEVMKKLSYAETAGLIREGHAPGLVGKELQAYLTGGISSCHESISGAEAIEKLRAGCKIQLREGSYARNLVDLGKSIKNDMDEAQSRWNNVIICSDDRHADDLLDTGHLDHSLNLLVNEVGLDPITAIQICTINPANHLQRPDLGSIGPGKTANIIRVDNLKHFKVLDVISRGKHVAHDQSLINSLNQPSYPDWVLNTVTPSFIPNENDFTISGPNQIEEGRVNAHVIGTIEHSLFTNHLIESVKIEDSVVVSEEGIDFFFLLDRYGKTENLSKSLVKGFNFEGKAAVASTVAHDSHQLLIVGNDRSCIHKAMQVILDSNGGQTIVAERNGGYEVKSLALPYAGLMSIDSPSNVAKTMRSMKQFSQDVVTGISEPFMSLSFMALPVIPKLKLTDRGLVDVDQFKLINLFDD